VELGELNFFVGPVVAHGDDADHVVFHEGLDVDILAQGWAFNEGNLCPVVGEGFQDSLGVAAKDRDFYLRIFDKKRSNEAREQILANGLGGGYGKDARITVGGSSYGLTSLLGQVGEFFGEGKQGRTGRSKRELTSGAVKESDGKLGLEGFDLLGDRGLGEEEFLGGHAEVQVACGRAEDLEAEIFHLEQRTGLGVMWRVWGCERFGLLM